MSRHQQDHHDGMEVHMSAPDGMEHHDGMKVAMSGDHEHAYKRPKGHGEKVKMNG